MFGVRLPAAGVREGGNGGYRGWNDADCACAWPGESQGDGSGRRSRYPGVTVRKLLSGAVELLWDPLVKAEHRPAWRNTLDALLSAPSVSDAQDETSELIDIAIPGGAVLADDAAHIVAG